MSKVKQLQLFDVERKNVYVPTDIYRKSRTVERSKREKLLEEYRLISLEYDLEDYKNFIELNIDKEEGCFEFPILYIAEAQTRNREEVLDFLREKIE